MGTTPDCGPHCKPVTQTQRQHCCSCVKCHGKPSSSNGNKK